MAKMKIRTIKSTGEDVKQLDLSHTADGNEKLYSHDGNIEQLQLNIFLT